MSLEEFRGSLGAPQRPELPAPLLALWHDARGDWDGAHQMAQVDGSADSAWVHAYLHRKEGDAGNANYWYRRAGRPSAKGDLGAEWAEIATALLAAL
jgi:hypothetical protein